MDEIRGQQPTQTLQGEPDFFKIGEALFLEQGDIIPRSATIIDGVLRKYHPYHVEKPANEMFAVLTQSCDLVKHNGQTKARYIALAPLRPLRTVLNREFRDVLVKPAGGLYVIGSEDTKNRYEDFLTKLINNNDPRFFFVPQRPELHIAEDMCIMLPLAMSIRIDHYDLCLAGRVAQISDLFQAKLGWLLGQQFSRVGTPDWTPTGLAEKVKSVSERSLTWMPDHQFSQMKKIIRDFESKNPGIDVDELQFTELCKKLQSKRDVVISAVIDTLVKLGKIPSPPNSEVFKVRKELSRNPTIAKFFPGA